MKNGIPEVVGGMVDSLFLSVPRVVGALKRPRDVTRAEYEAHLDFYIHEGFVARPEDFFTFPAGIPDHEIIEQRPYLTGSYQLISYPSGYEPRNPLLRQRYLSHSRNATGYIARWTHGTKEPSTVLCLHGYLLGDPQQAQRMFNIDRLFAHGLDVALFVAPFHWRRAPLSRAQRGIFLQNDDAAMTCECVGHAMHDLKAACGVLSRMGSARTGLIGASLGGYLSALYACLQSDVDFSAMMVPAVSLSKPLGTAEARFGFPADTLLREKMRMVYELHSPLNFSPRLGKDRILVVASRGDLLCPFAFVHELCERWGWPDHAFLRGGHWLIFDGALRGRAWYSFLQRMGYLAPGPQHGEV